MLHDLAYHSLQVSIVHVAWVRAHLSNSAGVQDHDLVGGLHGGQPVGDDQDGAARHQALNRLLHQPLAHRVQRTRRLYTMILLVFLCSIVGANK